MGGRKDGCQQNPCRTEIGENTNRRSHCQPRAAGDGTRQAPRQTAGLDERSHAEAQRPASREQKQSSAREHDIEGRRQCIAEAKLRTSKEAQDSKKDPRPRRGCRPFCCTPVTARHSGVANQGKPQSPLLPRFAEAPAPVETTAARPRGVRPAADSLTTAAGLRRASPSLFECGPHGRLSVRASRRRASWIAASAAYRCSRWSAHRRP